jgi:two-component system CheB/CheR fusion protein
VKEYEEYLSRDPAEVELLFQDILIGVTTFFRDPDSFCSPSGPAGQFDLIA